MGEGLKSINKSAKPIKLKKFFLAMTSTNFSNKIDSGVVEVVWGRGVMAAARDLKSRDLESCGFDSRRPYYIRN